jgi:hypothetical protein
VASNRERPRPRRRVVALVAVLTVAIAALFVSRSRQGAQPRAATAGPDEPTFRPSTASAPASAVASGITIIPKSGLLPGDTADASDEQRFLARMAETKKALLEKTRYPIGSRPLATKTDLIAPHHVEPTYRGLNGNPGGSHHVAIVQNQDRVLLTPGQSATVSITATADDVPVALTIRRSDLVPMIEDANSNVQPGAPIASVAFHDDGVLPDTTASDGTWTGTVTTTSGAAAGGVQLVVDARADGESGTLAFSFTQTPAAPASFTQTARDALEAGSIAIYVGVSVQQAGRYEIVGRLYDSTGAPLVYMRFIDDLTPASTEVRLLAYGAVILDEGGVPPFVLRDVEGSFFVLGGFPDREPMDDWPASYTTAKYALTSLTSADNDDPDKQRKIQALDKATQDGLANIRSGAPPTTPATTGPTSH